MRLKHHITAAALIAALAPSMAAAAITQAKVERQGPDVLNLTWTSPNPVDVYETDAAGTLSKVAQPLARGDRDGAFGRDHAGLARRYFLLVDQKDHQAITVAERALPLAQGSNFRDLGGYDAAGGKHVRWGMIYRSAGQPMLSDEDQAQIKALGLAQLVDLRSSEERVIAPSKIMGVPYAAIGYSMTDLLPQNATAMRNGADVYRRFPEMFAPQLRLIFAQLLNKAEPLAYNCSAGQDRTGFTTAIILSALGVPRGEIVDDYHLSTVYRRPQYELPKLDTATADNAAARLFAVSQKDPNWLTPQPLKDAEGRPYLDGAFAEIEAKWGSVDGYLAKEIGLTPDDIARLRRLYLQ